MTFLVNLFVYKFEGKGGWPFYSAAAIFWEAKDKKRCEIKTGLWKQTCYYVPVYEPKKTGLINLRGKGFVKKCDKVYFKLHLQMD